MTDQLTNIKARIPHEAGCGIQFSSAIPPHPHMCNCGKAELDALIDRLIEPTDEMLMAGMEYAIGRVMSDAAHEQFNELFKAMIRAAQEGEK